MICTCNSVNPGGSSFHYDQFENPSGSFLHEYMSWNNDDIKLNNDKSVTLSEIKTDVCLFLLQTIGYSCLPNAKDSDGLIALDLKHKIDYVKTNQQQLVESLHKILGGSSTLVVCVDGVRELPEDKWVLLNERIVE